MRNFSELGFYLSLTYDYLGFLLFFAAIKLYNKASGNAIPFGKTLPLIYFRDSWCVYIVGADEAYQSLNVWSRRKKAYFVPDFKSVEERSGYAFKLMNELLGAEMFA